MEADKLRELRELLADIGLGEWEAIGWHIRSPLSRGGWLIADCSGVTITSGNTVAMFIAALNNALPELLAIAEGAEADRADARCTWTQEDAEGSWWATDCGNEFVLNDGTPDDNRMQFCCYCSKPIVTALYEPDEDAAIDAALAGADGTQ